MTQASPHPDRILKLEGAFNVRDLGGYAVAGGETRFGRGLRADGLASLSTADIERLQAQGLRRVIDLRAPHEVDRHPGRLTGIDGIEVLNIPLFDSLAHDQTAWRRSDDPLAGFYREAVDTRGAMIREVFQAIDDAPDGAVLFHCTVGKDRTGLIAALWLSMAGAARDVVVQDYAMTAELIPGLIARFDAQARQHGVDPASYHPMLACKPHYMEGVLQHLEENFGGFSSYLADQGIAQAAQDRLAARLL